MGGKFHARSSGARADAVATSVSQPSRESSHPPKGDRGFPRAQKNRSNNSTRKVSFRERSEELEKLWRRAYKKAYQVPYRRGTIAERVELCATYLENLDGNFKRAKKGMLALFNHPELQWVTSVTLEWLANPSNMVFLGPVFKKKQRGTRVDFEGERSSTPSVTIKRRKR